MTVPASAKIYVNDRLTTSTGAQRQYMSRGLTPGRSYVYNVRAEMVRDGKTVQEVKVVRLRAGSNASVAFDFSGDSQEEQVAGTDVETKLTLHVPGEAKVFLSGKETESTGKVREFSTTKLTSDDQWQDYAVRVTVVRDGRELSEERTITLKSGDQRELRFDFDASTVARATR